MFRNFRTPGPLIVIGIVGITWGFWLLAKLQTGENLWLYPLHSIAQLLALTGATLLSINFFMSTRVKVLEGLFDGVDKLYRTHHQIGGIAFSLLLLHPVFLILNVLPDTKTALGFVLPGPILAQTLGMLTLWTLIVVLFITYYVKLPYHIWKKVHEFIGLALLFASLHVYLIYSDVAISAPLRFWMLFLLLGALMCYLYVRFVYPRFGPLYHYRVIRVIQHQEVTEVFMAAVTKPISFLPGQFFFISIPRISNERHPFSFAGSPDVQMIRFAAKRSGDYTLKFTDLKEGDVATIWGGYGRFADRLRSNKDAVFIAGGIGITPFLSMMAYDAQHPVISVTGSKRKITLIYSVHQKQDAIFMDELTGLAESSDHISVVLNTTADQGRLTAVQVSALVGDISSRLVFICGPQAMMEDLRRQFLELGVKQWNIILEDFSL